MRDQAANVAWMHELRERVHAWLRAGQLTRGETPAYVDLIFAFGLARIGADVESRELHRIAAATLADRDAAHRFLLAAYAWRIEEAHRGKPAEGPLPEWMYQRNDHLGRLHLVLGYNVDRLRRASLIVDPDMYVNPYRRWWARIDELRGMVAPLYELFDPLAFQDEVDRLLRSRIGDTPEGRSRIGEAVLRQHFLARADQVRPALRGVLAQKELRDESGWGAAFLDVDAAVRAAGRFGLRDELLALADEVRRCATRRGGGCDGLATLVRACIRALDAIDGPHGPEEFLAEISRACLRDLSPDEWAARATLAHLDELRLLLASAEHWYRFGKDRLAAPLFRKAISFVGALREQSARAGREQSREADEIVRTLGAASPPLIECEIEALLGAKLEFLESPKGEREESPAERMIRSLWERVADADVRRLVLSHARLREEASKANRDLARLAIQIGRSLRSASRPVAAVHIASLFETLPPFEDGYTTRSHFHATALEFVEALCLTAVEVCSNG